MAPRLVLVLSTSFCSYSLLNWHFENNLSSSHLTAWPEISEQCPCQFKVWPLMFNPEFEWMVKLKSRIINYLSIVHRHSYWRIDCFIKNLYKIANQDLRSGCEHWKIRTVTELIMFSSEDESGVWWLVSAVEQWAEVKMNRLVSDKNCDELWLYQPLNCAQIRRRRGPTIARRKKTREEASGNFIIFLSLKIRIQI